MKHVFLPSLKGFFSNVLAQRPLSSFPFQANKKMKTIQRALVACFILILVHFLMASPPSLDNERQIHPIDRKQPRRLLVSVTSLSANVNKIDEAVKDPRKAVEASVRMAPSSGSNPSQNK